MRGPKIGEHTVRLKLSSLPDGEIVWWIEQTLGDSMTREVAGELVATLDDFLKDFIRPRG